MIHIYDKTLRKEPKSVQRSIQKALDKLTQRYDYYADRNIDIKNVFNDDILVHDIVNKEWYVYKCMADKMQIRILYTARGKDIIVAAHYIKQKDSKRYLSAFEEFATTLPAADKLYQQYSLAS